MSPSRWKFVTLPYVTVWSFGEVKSEADLYAPRIFGATANHRCECGELTGDVYVGQCCVECGVMVEGNYLAAQKTRFGHLRPRRLLTHPLTNEIITCLPILPLSYRVSSNAGNVTVIGEKYEKLIEMNFAINPIDDFLGDEEAYAAAIMIEHPDLEVALQDLFGLLDAQQLDWQGEPKSLAELLIQRIIARTDDVDIVSRGCGLAVELTAVL